MKRTIINIVKIGTNLLTTHEGNLDLNNLRSLVEQIAREAKNTKQKFIIVTSGAITCGSTKMKIKPKNIQEKQAAAAIGQSLLMQEYSRFFSQYEQITGQILLTKDCIDNKIQNKNAKNTICELLKLNIIPIINENDSVATEEIDSRFRDNDALSSYVAKIIKADKLILLTNADGVFTANPEKNKTAKLIKSISKITDELINSSEESQSSRSKGGMKSKLAAAKEAAASGTEVIIANGRSPNIIHSILKNDYIGTLIPANKKGV
ncbi:glutamate 5-kinase [Candidatus Margulisiibacteriota bacterium]